MTGGSEVAQKKDGDKPAEDYRESVRWLLECVQAGEPIRLNCGGEEYRDKKGQTWGKDRFFLGGKAEKGWFQGGVHGTEDPALYIAGRAFSWDGTDTMPGYLFPLPAGHYQVRLHFADLSYKAAGFQAIGIVIQGKEVLRDFDPMASGHATAIVMEFPAWAADGLLEVRFTRAPLKLPVTLCAIEIERLE